MEHKYTVSLEESNEKQEKVNGCKERSQKLDAEIRQLQITINKQAEEVGPQHEDIFLPSQSMHITFLYFFVDKS